tara:strand:+ start:229 stop:570 length:342 start_codon:yes stop_codon:yes gene_type:complete
MNKNYYWYKATVVRIIDADTIVLDIDLGMHLTREETVRLYRINAFELRGHEKYFGLKAKTFVEDFCPVNSAVDVHTYKDKAGKYGRLLADIYVEDECLNDRLVEEEHARYVSY